MADLEWQLSSVGSAPWAKSNEQTCQVLLILPNQEHTKWYALFIHFNKYQSIKFTFSFQVKLKAHDLHSGKNKYI